MCTCVLVHACCKRVVGNQEKRQSLTEENSSLCNCVRKFKIFKGVPVKNQIHSFTQNQSKVPGFFWGISKSPLLLIPQKRQPHQETLGCKGSELKRPFELIKSPTLYLIQMNKRRPRKGKVLVHTQVMVK